MFLSQRDQALADQILFAGTASGFWHNLTFFLSFYAHCLRYCYISRTRIIFTTYYVKILKDKFITIGCKNGTNRINLQNRMEKHVKKYHR